MTRRRLLLALILCALIPAAALAGGIPAGPNVQVTDAGLGRLDDAERPEIAIQGSTLYTAWLDTRGGSSTQQPIYFARSDDGGANWGTNTRASILDYVGFTERPVISVAPDGSIWIAWWLRRCFEINGECGGVDRFNDVRLALSQDGGATFEEYRGFDGNDSADDIDGYPEIHADNDRTLVLVSDPQAGGADILIRDLRRSTPGVLSTQTIRVSEGSGNGRVTDGIIPDGPRMSLAVRGDTVCATWEDRRARFAIFGACSTDRGATWGANAQISGSDDFNPRLAFAPDGTLYASYQDVEGGPVVLRRSADNGVTWDTPNQAFGFDTSDIRIGSYDLDVDPAGQVLLSVALASRFGRSSDLYLATSVDRGQRFALAGPLEDGQGEFPTVSTQVNPRTVVGSGPNGPRAFVIWGDDRNTQEQIWSTRVDLDGTPPGAPANLSARGGDTTIALSWNAATDQNGIAGYHVLRATAEGGPFTQITPRLVTGTTYRDVGLDTTTYFYQVFAVDGTGNPGPPSNVASAAATVGSGLAGLRGTIAYEAPQSIAVRDFAGGAVGPQRVLGEGISPTFSHDGQRILAVVSSGSQGSVISRQPDGGDARTIYSTDTLLSEIDSTADSNVLAGVFGQIYAAPTFCQAFEPRVVSLAPRQQLYGVGSALATDIAVSSDRSLLAYTYRNWCNGVASGVYDVPRLCVVNTATQQESCLDGADAEGSDFVPGRARLVFSASFTGQRELWRADVGANGALANFAQLTRGPAGQPSTGPRVSTDGTWVIFERDLDPGTGENYVLHVVRLDGDGLRSLGVAGRAPDWAGGGSPPELGPPGSNRAFLPLVRRR